MKKLTLLLILFSIGQNTFAQLADKVLRNGKIYTANDSQPYAEAIAIKEGIFIFVGSNQDVLQHIGTATLVEDLEGRLLLPGIHDVHQHPLEAGSPIAGDCALDNQETNPENLALALADCNLKPNSNGWIIAFGHSIYALYEANRNPKEILDDYYPNNPILVIEETSHSIWVNSKALEILQITKATADPVGGYIFKDSEGEPNGILMDNAGDAALALAFASNQTTDKLNYEGLIEYSLPLLARNGITSICEGRTYWKRNYIEIWKKIKQNDLLTVRVNLAPWVYPDDADSNQIPMLKSLYDTGDDMLKISQIKLYSDGITINATAALHQAYRDNLGLPFDKGLNYIDANRLANLITDLEKTGFDFHIHAIGDRGITEALDAIQSARNTNGDLGARHRVTHLEIMDSADYDRFASLNVTADVQVAGDFTKPENWSENDFLIGSERSKNLIPLKSLFDNGARITLSSDWDVSTVNPFVGIQNALTRSPQALPSLEEIVKSYTINAAYVMRQEDKTGSIEIGKLADFIFVNQDIFMISPNKIKETEVLSTHLNGKEIYRSASIPPIGTIDIPPLGLNDNQNKETFKLFPNPSNDTIKIDIAAFRAKSITIYSTNGKLIQELIIDNDKLIEIDISKYSKGVYHLELKLKNGSSLSTKFIKE